MSENEIYFFNRKSKKLEKELVYGDKAIKFIYTNPLGSLFGKVIASKWVSQIYGGYQDLALSSKKVAPFIKKFNIDLDEYEPGSISSSLKENSYKNFNEFFIRKFKPTQRSFNCEENIMPAFCEARYFGHEQIDHHVKIPVKGQYLSAAGLLGNSKWSSVFEGGPFLVARLCPVDYHRYHYPADGKTLDHFQIKGQFHSVNPLALKAREDIFIVNERRVSILDTKKFGKLAYIEVGAAMVGKIIQSFDENNPFNRGDEKGYFLFGGSTVVVLGEKGKWAPSEDIVKNTQQGVETYIKLGDEVARLGSNL
ncbi:MAG: phosphatidylserine decarboxylase [Bacteriovoracaceae bacterium]|jgi:phosphatidylserine decarboxylase|nr:phosphatidylserine decarboxylase [Bacteriovoracaceae bacterium]